MTKLEQLEADLVVARSEATVAVETMAEAWAKAEIVKLKAAWAAGAKANAKAEWVEAQVAWAKANDEARDKDNVVESIKAGIKALKEKGND